MQLDVDGIVDDAMATAIKSDLRTAGNRAITVLINSPGGSVFSGLAIYDALARHKGHVSVVISGLAASIASIIAMAGDTISIGEASQLMIHRPWSAAIGYADDLRAEAAILDQIEDNLVSIYASRSGQSQDRIRSWVRAGDGTWFNGKEAVEAGLADTVIPLKQKAANIAATPAAMRLDRAALIGGLDRMRSAGLLQGTRMALASPPNCKAPVVRRAATWTSPIRAMRQPALRGYVALFRTPFVAEDGTICVFTRTAFDAVLASKPYVEAWLSHEPGTAFADTKNRTLRLAKDAHGIAFQAEMSDLRLLDHFRGMLADESIGASPGFKCSGVKEKIDGEPVTIITTVSSLREISITATPGCRQTHAKLVDLADELPFHRAVANGSIHTDSVFAALIRGAHKVMRGLDEIGRTEAA